MRLLLAITLAVSAVVAAAQQATDPETVRKQQEAAVAAAADMKRLADAADAKRAADQAAAARYAAAQQAAKEDAVRRVAAAEAARLQQEQGRQASCLHGSNETPEQRVRRESAEALARQISSAEARYAETHGRVYAPLRLLRHLDPVPEGMDLGLTSDGRGYALSIKDVQDPCYFALFSDQHGRIYSAGSAPMLSGQPVEARTMPVVRTRGKMPFEGEWVSAEATNGVTAVTVSQEDGEWFIQAWGKCRPLDCDWGRVPLSIYQPLTELPPPANRGIARWDLPPGKGTVKKTLMLRYDSNALTVESYSVLFPDGRGNYHSEGRFVRRQVRAER